MLRTWRGTEGPQSPRDDEATHEPGVQAEPVAIDGADAAHLQTLRYQELAARGSYGDARAAAELVRSHLPLLRNLVALNVPAVDLEDVLHDCLVALLLSLASLREAKAYRSWMIGVALKVVAKYHRAQRVRRQWVVHGVELDNSPAVGCSPEQRVEVTRLRALLGAMDPELREVLLSRQADGLPMREVARDAGISLATVKRRLSRAREALEVLRDGPCPAPEDGPPPELGSSGSQLVDPR